MFAEDDRGEIMARRLITLLAAALALSFVTATTAETRLYWSDHRDFGIHGYVDSTDPDGSNRRNVLKLPVNHIVWGIAVEPARGELYWGQQFGVGPGSVYSIQRSSFTGCVQLLRTPNRTLSIALDGPRNKMYWVENTSASAEGVVYRANLDGSEPEVFLDGLTAMQAVALDPIGDPVYWAELTRIARANLDGSNIETVVIENFPGDLELDVIASKVYWHTAQAVKRAGLDGSDPEVIVLATDQQIRAIGLDPIEGKVYWSGYGDPPPTYIRRADVDGSNVEIVVSPDVRAPSLVIADDIGPQSCGTDVPATGSGGRIVLLAVLAIAFAIGWTPRIG
jgi:hypothetical protein